MKGHVDFGSLSIVVIGIALYIIFIMFMFTQWGYITIQVTGQPQIDSLAGQLSVCEENLSTKCDPCPECVKNDSSLSSFILGIVVGFFYFLMFGDTKKWLLNRLKDSEKKKKGSGQHV